MTTLSWVPRINASKTISVTPVISTSIYASGDQIGGIMTLTDVIRNQSIPNTVSGSDLGWGWSEICEVTVLDSDKQDVAFDIWLFNQSPTVTSTDNAAFAMTAANMKLQCIGVIKGIGANSSGDSNYSDAAAVSTSSNPNINKPVQVPFSATNKTNIYAIAVVRGTPTYTTTSSLQFQFSFYMD